MTSAEDPTLVLNVKPGKSEHSQEETNGVGDIKQSNGNKPNTIYVDLFINNVVCSFSTRCHLALRRIATEGMNVEYKKENNMLNMRLRRPHTTASIWSSGKITCTGATSEPDAYKAARRYSRLLQKLKFNVRIAKYRVVNVLATCQMPFSIDIHHLAQNHERECSYEPELHPGATFKINELSATLKLFTTGSITLTAPSVSLVERAVYKIFPIVYQFRRKVEEPAPFPTPVVQQPPQYSNSQNTIIINKQSNCSKEIIMAQRIGDTVVLNGYGSNQALIQISNNTNNQNVSSSNNNNTPHLITQYTANVFDHPASSSSSMGGYHHHPFGGISDFYPSLNAANPLGGPGGGALGLGTTNTSSIQPTSYFNNNFDVFSSSLHHQTFPVADQQATSQATTQSFHWYSENVLEDFLP